MSKTTNINELLKGHVTLEVECLDRLYLNGYLPRLATGAQLVTFLREQLGKPIPSPVLLGQITQGFVSRVKKFSEQKKIPLIAFERYKQRKKDAVANELRQERPVRDEVVFIGVAQEKAKTFSARKVGSYFHYERDKTVCVNHYYFYIDDADFGPGFIKICSYAPWSMKVCLNGHEWAKRQLEKRKIAYEALDNGFLACADAKGLQEVCDKLGPAEIERFFEKWLKRVPVPLGDRDRVAGYDWRLSIWQMEVSLTQIFDRPLRGREFFEQVIRDNVDLGRPDRVQLVFPRKITKKTPGLFRTRVITEGVSPSLHIEYKSFDLKQYFKEGRGLRTEGTFKDTRDFGVNKGLGNMPYLQQLGRQINRRLLEVERVSHNCGLAGSSIQRLVQPTVTEDGKKASALRFGDPRVMALFLALTLFSHLINGFRNRDLRRHVAALLADQVKAYSSSQMTYDLRRLMGKGIVYRPQGSHRYYLTPYGWKVARLFSRLEAHVFRPVFNAIHQERAALPRALVDALEKVDGQLDLIIYHGFPVKKVA